MLLTLHLVFGLSGAGQHQQWEGQVEQRQDQWVMKSPRVGAA